TLIFASFVMFVSWALGRRDSRRDPGGRPPRPRPDGFGAPSSGGRHRGGSTGRDANGLPAHRRRSSQGTGAGFDAQRALLEQGPVLRASSALRDAGIALWDVLHTCERDGSLDSSIARGTMATNDFRALLAAYPGIGAVFFNGAKAEQIYRRKVALTPVGVV